MGLSDKLKQQYLRSVKSNTVKPKQASGAAKIQAAAQKRPAKTSSSIWMRNPLTGE